MMWKSKRKKLFKKCHCDRNMNFYDTIEYPIEIYSKQKQKN